MERAKQQVGQRARARALGGRFREHARALTETLCRTAADGKMKTAFDFRKLRRTRNYSAVAQRFSTAFR